MKKASKIPESFKFDLFETIEHFYSRNYSWNLHVTSEHAKLLKKYMPYLKIKKSKQFENDGRPYEVSGNTKDFPAEHLMLYYKDECEYYRDAYWKLRNDVENAINGR